MHIKCHKCKGKMEDTKNTSFGTGEPIFRCKKCGWTASYGYQLKKVIDNKDFTKEDIIYNGIKYSDYKAVIEIVDASGKQRIKFITFRADLITDIMKAGLVLQAFEPGDVLTIKAAPNGPVAKSGKAPGS